MKTTKTTLLLICLLACFTASAQKINAQDVIKNAPKEMPDKVKLTKSQREVPFHYKTLTYIYDRENRLIEIKSDTKDYNFKYSYANGRVSRVIVEFRDNSYVQADFTYDAKGVMTKVVRSGKQKATLNLTDKYRTHQTFTWTDAAGRLNELYMDITKNNQRVVEHRIGKDAFRFEYDKGTNGLENLPVPITLATYMAMEYYTTDFYSDGFFQCIMCQPISRIIDPRENGRIYTYTNTKGLYTYLTRSSVKSGNDQNRWEFTYKKPSDGKLEYKGNKKLETEKKVINIKK